MRVNKKQERTKIPYLAIITCFKDKSLHIWQGWGKAEIVISYKF